MPDYSPEQILNQAFDDLNNRLKVDSNFTLAGDIEIGAVELKDGATDQRASVDANGALLIRNDKAGTTTDADDVTVDGSAGGVQLLGANAARKSAIIQNTGTANMRVTTDGSAPTATHGKQITPGGVLRLSMPYCPTAAVKAKREGGSSTSANASETV